MRSSSKEYFFNYFPTFILSDKLFFLQFLQKEKRIKKKEKKKKKKKKIGTASEKTLENIMGKGENVCHLGFSFPTV